MSTELAQREKLKRLKEERLKNISPSSSSNRLTSQNIFSSGAPQELKSKPSFLTDKKKTPVVLEPKNEVVNDRISRSSQSNDANKNSNPPTATQSSSSLIISAKNVQEEKRLRNQMRRERMKQKREEKKRELLEAMNNPVPDVAKEKGADNTSVDLTTITSKQDVEEMKESYLPLEVEKPVIEASIEVTEVIKFHNKPSQSESKLERKVRKNIQQDLENLEDVSSDSFSCNEEREMEQVDVEIKLSKEEEALSVKAMILDFEEEEPSDWEEREPLLEGEEADCDDPEISISLDPEDVVLLSSDDESKVDKKRKSKKSLVKEIIKGVKDKGLKIENVSRLEQNKKSEELDEDTNCALVLSDDLNNEDNVLQLEKDDASDVEFVENETKALTRESDAIGKQRGGNHLTNKNEECDKWVDKEQDWVDAMDESSPVDDAKMELHETNEINKSQIGEELAEGDADELGVEKIKIDELEEGDQDGEELEVGEEYGEELEVGEDYGEELEVGEDYGQEVGEDYGEEVGEEGGDELEVGEEGCDELEREKDGDELYETEKDVDQLGQVGKDNELDQVEKYVDEFDLAIKDGDESEQIEKYKLKRMVKNAEELNKGKKEGNLLWKSERDGDKLEQEGKDCGGLDSAKDGEQSEIIKKYGDSSDDEKLEKLNKEAEELKQVEEGDDLKKNKSGDEFDKGKKDCDGLSGNKADDKSVKDGDEDNTKGGDKSEEKMEVDELGQSTKDHRDDELVRDGDNKLESIPIMDVIEKNQSVEKGDTLSKILVNTKITSKLSEAKMTDKETSRKNMLKVGEKLLAEGEWMENVDWVEKDAWTDQQDEELEDGEIKMIGSGQQFEVDKSLGHIKKCKTSEIDGEKSQDESSIPSPATSHGDSLAETEDSQFDHLNLIKGNKIEIDSAETKFDLLFKSGPSNNRILSKPSDIDRSKTGDIIKSKDLTPIVSQIENNLVSKHAANECSKNLTINVNVEPINEGEAPVLREIFASDDGGGELTIDEAPILIMEGEKTNICEPIKVQCPKINVLMNETANEDIKMDTSEEENFSAAKTTEVTREGSLMEETDDARLQLDFSSEDEISVTLTVKEDEISETETNITNGNDVINEDQVDDKPKIEIKADESLTETLNSRKRVNEEVNLEVFVTDQITKKAKLEDEKNFEDNAIAEVNPMDESDEYKALRIPASPRKLTMFDLETIIRAKIFNYVEECNKAKMDALGERVEELEKQVERWKKRAAYLETQVKDAESEIELYKVQVATNKTNEKVTKANSNPNKSPNSSTVHSVLSKPLTTTTANTFSRKSTTTPAMSMASTSTSMAPNRNAAPPPSSVPQSNTKKVESTPSKQTAVPLQLIANTALTGSPTKPKPVTLTKPPVPVVKQSATIIDLTEEEEDKNSKVSSSPGRQVLFKPPKTSVQTGRSLLQSNSNHTPVSVSLPVGSSGQMVTLPMMPGTSMPSMVQLIPQGAATIAPSIGSGVRLNGPNTNIRSSTFPNQAGAGAQVAYLFQGGSSMANQSGAPNRHQLFTLPTPGGILQNTSRPGQLPTFLLMRNPITTQTGRMTAGNSPSINTIPVGSSGLSISLSRPQALIQPIANPGTSKQRHPIPTINLSMPTGTSVAQRPKNHPADLPVQPHYQSTATMKLLPPRPSLKISKVSTGIVLSWNMTVNATHADIVSYQLYAYQETAAPPSTALWKKVGDVKALPLPMACTLTQFIEGNRYYFAVRAVDKHNRIGPFSDPTHIVLPSKQ